MGILVTFGKSKHKRIAYTTKRANTVIALYNFFRHHQNYVRTRDIKAEVKVSNLTLWFLAYQNFLVVRPKFCRYTDPVGKTRYAQVYTFKPNLPRFQQFYDEAKKSEKRLNELKKETKGTETAPVEDILKKQQDFEADEYEEPVEDESSV